MNAPTVFHPARKEHAEQFIAALADEKSRKYATAQLTFIFSGGKRPQSTRGISKARVKELDAALYAIFATLR